MAADERQEESARAAQSRFSVEDRQKLASRARELARHAEVNSRYALAFLALWGLVLTVVASVLMVGHWVTLPAPEAGDQQLRAAVADLPQSESGQWHLVHFLYGKCKCSQRTLDYLFERQRPTEARETLVLIDPDEEQARRAAAAKLNVEVLTREQLKQRFGVESAPLLLIANPDGEIAYVGGYTPRKQGLDYQDLSLLGSLKARVSTESLPLFGCGVSRELQAYLDPIGIKYRE